MRSKPSSEAIAVALLMLLAAAHAWPTLWSAVDDAFISARYAEHVAGGLGWTWSTRGAPVEGFSNPLWTAWIAIGLAAGADAHTWMVGWGLVGLVASIPASWLLARSLADAPGPGALVAPLAITASPFFAVAATNGLETAWFLAGILLASWAALEARSTWTELAAGLGLGLLGWLRPEGILVAPVWLAVRAMRGAPLRGIAAGWLAPVALLFAWRLATFGALLPNTAGAKLGAYEVRRLAEGNLRYLGRYGPLAPALVGLVGWILWRDGRTPARLGAAATALALVLPALAVELWMPGWRLLVPSWGLVAALLGAAACVPGRGQLATGLALLPLLAGPWVRNRDADHTVLPGNATARAGLWLREHAPEGATLAVRDAGVLAFYAGPGFAATETHERALTRVHPAGADLPHGAPENPTVVVFTVARRDAADLRYDNDRQLQSELTVPYVRLGRVRQHFHRYYDIYVRFDAEIPALPAELVVAPQGAR